MPSKKYNKILESISNKKLQEAQQKIGEIQEELLYALDQFSREKESSEAGIKLEGLKTYYEMRKVWGDFLKKCLAIILAFNILLVIFVGLGFLKYTDDWFLRIVLTTNLADIIGLVYLVVNFLFSNQPEKNDNQIEANSKPSPDS